MASLITEIYISVDGLNYTSIDLYKDESFSMKYSKKDIQDISKVFAPFSQDYTFPATPKNKAAFGFFGNTQVLKINPDNKFKCKTYTNGQLNLKGLFTLRSVKYKEGKADVFTGSFSTDLLSLKDRIKDDTLHDLTTQDYSISWRADNVKDLLQGAQVITKDGIGIAHYIPLYSNNRVFKSESDIISADNYDNVFLTGSNDPRSDNVINIGELRPCINITSILALIKKKYSLNITIPIDQTEQVASAYMWCNGENFARKLANLFVLKQQFTSSSPGFFNVTANLTDSSILITNSQDIQSLSLIINFNELVIGENNNTANIYITLVKKSTNEAILEYEQLVTNSNFTISKKIPTALFTSNELEFYVLVKFDVPVFWKFTSMSFGAFQSGQYYLHTFTNNNNILETGSHKLNLIQALPDMKVLDFFQSFLKVFNISVFDSSPSDDNLFFLTPKDLTTPNKSYTKKEADYTMYSDEKEVVKSVNNPYNCYLFRHVVSKYRSNVDFRKQFGKEYGSATYPTIKPAKPNEYKIETGFSIVPPVKVSGTNTYTAYGFTDATPNIVNTNFFRYTPNLNEPTLFINHGNVVFPTDNRMAVQSTDNLGVLITATLFGYIKTMPFAKNSLDTLSFSILTIDNVDYTKSLFLNFYSEFIKRLLNTNALVQTYSITLPSTEIYLNDYGLATGDFLTSTGFRLQNDIIIGETKFEILEGNIDLTTGKSKFTLLNY